MSMLYYAIKIVLTVLVIVTVTVVCYGMMVFFSKQFSGQGITL